MKEIRRIFYFLWIVGVCFIGVLKFVCCEFNDFFSNIFFYERLVDLKFFFSYELILDIIESRMEFLQFNMELWYNFFFVFVVICRVVKKDIYVEKLSIVL